MIGPYARAAATGAALQQALRGGAATLIEKPQAAGACYQSWLNVCDDLRTTKTPPV
jgi:hypothetical protein